MCKKCFLFPFFPPHSVADYYINLAGTFDCTWVSIILSNHLPAPLKTEDETLEFGSVQTESSRYERVTAGATFITAFVS